MITDLNTALEIADKSNIAYHEAGHVVVAAIHDGLYCSAYIQPSGTDDPIYNKTWIGRTYGNGLSATTCVAGPVAEWLRGNPELDAYDCMELAEDDLALSETDKMQLSGDWDEQFAAFEVAIEILRNNKPFLDYVAGELLGEECITGGEVQEWLDAE